MPLKKPVGSECHSRVSKPRRSRRKDGNGGPCPRSSDHAPTGRCTSTSTINLRIRNPAVLQASTMLVSESHGLSQTAPTYVGGSIDE